MKAFIGFLKQKSIIQLVGIIALCTLVWFAGPWVAIAGRTPFLPEFNRLLAILGIVVVWVFYILFTQARARRTDRQLIADLSAPEIDPDKEALAKAQDEEVMALQGKFADALQKLKGARAANRRDKRYLYELPWYVIIGAPGSGKTTALINSGLKFPISERPDRNAIHGVGGTRNCDWFFADEAIFIDTAGRYTTQDSHQPVDEAAWKGFLDLIKKHRPRRPINGVLVTMSMSDLLQGDEETRNRHAMDVRQRIQELYAVLNVRFPVYMLFTKCDLVAGFTDFFADLNPEMRAQVWGETLPGGDGKSVEEQLFGFGDSFDELMKRLNRRSFRRIQEERDLPRRAQILDFPQQMALLKSSLMRFLSEAFSASRYDTDPLLRGVYFTSGTQEGTPIDRVLGRLADTYGFDRQRQPVFSGRGKAFFITRLLKEVVIPEAELTGVDPRIERRRSGLQRLVYGALLALLVGATALWSVSYINNKKAIDAVKHQIDRFEAAGREKTRRDPRDVMPLLARLNILKAARDVYREHSLWMRFGLYQGEKLQSEIDRAYRQLLKNDLMPLIQLRLEQRLYLGARTMRTTDSEVLLELLKSYLMLGQPEKLEPTLVGAIVAREWERSYAREPQVLSELIAHTDHLLTDGNWLDPIVLNASLVGDVRRKLNAIPLSMQIYAQLKSEAFSDASHDFRLSDNLGRYGDRVFDEKTIPLQKIPGLYTRYGYTTFFKMQGLGFVKRALTQNWVLENPAADQAGDLNRLYDDLERLYFAEYEKRWRQLLNDMKLRPVQGVNETIQVLDILSSPDTPIRPLLEAVQANTALTASLETESSAASGQKKSGDAGEPAAGLNPALPAVAVPAPLREMERRFEDLNGLVQGTKTSPPPLDHVLSRLAALRDDMMVIGSSAKSDEQALRMARERMSGAGASDSIKLAKLEFGRLPEPLRRWFLSLTSFGWKLTLKSAKAELNAIWQQEVLTPYHSGLDRRYPLFADSPHDATLIDFSRFFAPDGTLDRYFQAHVQPFVDTSRSQWRQVAMDDQGMGLSPAVLKQFQYAAKIRRTLFAAGGQTPSLQFELRPVSLDENIAALRLNMEGQTLVYSHGPIRSTRFQWPGPDTDIGVRLTYQTLDGREINQSEEGPWALFRILDKARVEATAVPDRFRVTFLKEGYRARFELRAGSADNPFKLLELKRFRCPEGL
jgi:type VI secretion system protein ImpL